MKFRPLNLRHSMKICRFPNGPRLGLFLLPLAFAALAADSGRTNSTPAKLSFSEFSVITDRNIFNAKRYPRNAGAPVVRRDNSRAVRTEYFALLGIIQYEKGPFAFFDGSSASSRKSATVNDEISGFKIKAILPSAVLLESGTNHVELPLGKQLRRPDGGQWQVADRAEVSFASNDRRSESRSSGDRRESSGASPVHGNESGSFDQSAITVTPGGAEGTTVISFSNGDLPPPTVEGVTIQVLGGAAPAGTAAPAAAVPEDDVLRRLMQRREQELNR